MGGASNSVPPLLIPSLLRRSTKTRDLAFNSQRPPLNVHPAAIRMMEMLAIWSGLGDPGVSLGVLFTLVLSVSTPTS